MSHHSDKPMDDQDMSKYKEVIDNSAFGEKLLQDKIFSIPPLPKPEEIEAGATGNFPDGKITEEDRGEIAIKIGIKDGKVIMDFGKEPISWVGMTPDEALALGRFLFEKADEIKHGS